MRVMRVGDRWEARRGAGVALRIAVAAAPLVASIVTGWALTRATTTPGSLGAVLVRWAAVLATSGLAFVAVERATRRLLPLATLLRLSIAFPDETPSRLRVALRSGSSKRLERLLDDARAGRAPQAASCAAQRSLELVAAMDLHDRRLRGHSERVGAYSRMIGERLGLDGDELDRLEWAGLLHDDGKLLVPAELLAKKGRLTPDEFEVVKAHPELGRDLVAPLVPWLGEAARAVWEHHERFGGGGYPSGLAGDDISPISRIVSVADAYDVITSVRSYASRESPAAARAELVRCAGTQFDPAVVEAFVGAEVGSDRWVTAPLAALAQVPLLPQLAFGSLLRAAAAATGATLASVVATPTSAAEPLDLLRADEARPSPVAPAGAATTSTDGGDVGDEADGPGRSGSAGALGAADLDGERLASRGGDRPALVARSAAPERVPVAGDEPTSSAPAEVADPGGAAPGDGERVTVTTPTIPTVAPPTTPTTPPTPATPPSTAPPGAGGGVPVVPPASLPEVPKNTRDIGTGARCNSASAHSPTTSTLMLLKVWKNDRRSLCWAMASVISLRP